MAKHRKRRRRYRRYLRGQANEAMGLGTLGGTTFVSVNYDESVNERTYVSSLIATHTLQNYTKGVDDGPIMVGVAHSDYTSAEIEEWVENIGSWNEGDLVNQEIAKRKIRRIGVFDSPDDATTAVVLNNGKPIRTKLGWILLQGQSLKQWAYNMGSSPLATSAPNYFIEGHVNLWPL